MLMRADLPRLIGTSNWVRPLKVFGPLLEMTYPIAKSELHWGTSTFVYTIVLTRLGVAALTASQIVITKRFCRACSNSRRGTFILRLLGKPDRTRVLRMTRRYLKPGHRIFVGVVSPIDSRIENPKEIRDRILEAARYIPVEQLGTTDDCGFSPFCDDASTTREKAFAKIRSRVEGTVLAEEIINDR